MQDCKSAGVLLLLQQTHCRSCRNSISCCCKDVQAAHHEIENDHQITTKAHAQILYKRKMRQHGSCKPCATSVTDTATNKSLKWLMPTCDAPRVLQRACLQGNNGRGDQIAACASHQSPCHLCAAHSWPPAVTIKKFDSFCKVPEHLA